MQTAGFGEERQAALRSNPQELVGQVRRIAGIGPAYEVLRLVGESKALIHVFESVEEVALKIEDIVNDPISETIP
jgi:hypothetical protein